MWRNNWAVAISLKGVVWEKRKILTTDAIIAILIGREIEEAYRQFSHSRKPARLKLQKSGERV